MDGRERWIDNCMIERLLRSLKYESVYIRAFETGGEVLREIGERSPTTTPGGPIPGMDY